MKSAYLSSHLYYSWLAILFICPYVHGIIIIDDFTTSQSVSSGSSYSIVSASILGGECDIETNNYATAEINTTVSNQAVLIGRPSVPYYGYFGFSYDGSGYSNNGLNNIDLTNGGELSGFQIDITQIGESGGTFYIEVGNGEQVSVVLVSLSDVGKILLPFEMFEAMPSSSESLPEVDFSNVGYIKLLTWVKSGEITAIDSFTVVPEPLTVLLLAMGVISLRKRN